MSLINKHLIHVEDDIFNNGRLGYEHVITQLYSVYDKLHGRRLDRSLTTIKKDGSPSIIFGTNPENNRFFVGTKSVFNKKPKINYTFDDISINHGHSSGLVQKLQTAITYLPAVTPVGYVYQCDMMYTDSDIIVDQNYVKFKPNTIEYAISKNCDEGRKILKSKIGIVLHTEYKSENNTLIDLTANFITDTSHFNLNDSVHIISHKYVFSECVDSHLILEEFNRHIEYSKEMHNQLTDYDYDLVKTYSPHLNMYINHCIRSNTMPSYKNLNNWLYRRYHTDFRKKEKTLTLMFMNQLHYSKNVFDNIFKLHYHLTSAKECLISVLDNNQKYKHYIDNILTGPEGYVNIVNNTPRKFVKRQEFSAANFKMGKPNV